MIERDIHRVLGLLGQDDTLQVFAGLVLRPGDPPAEVTGLKDEAAERALERLARAGLAVREGDGWRAEPEAFRSLLRAAPKERTTMLDTFLVDGRLASIPTKRAKRLVVLDYVAQVFEPGIRYPEKEVNVALRAFHDDYAALRRYLVEEEFLSRENNVYWRSGGSS
ncbi:hypothetical protein Pth03_40090 [Planotetraspora thailandica]|uniref:DUF2087 domain-containing protein n=1 Tax=Planotetraspora thailandica TaxID=487172 RepID=A0A8J3VDE5_9ACTN|nr:DUF2087 domain-containing protein [Planotetraspora thailandica]GII55620.1 hypothetical protein Pth03_40090 [Planotetraspora thailandica]